MVTSKKVTQKIGYTAIGAGIGVHSAFEGGDSLTQMLGDEDHR